MYPVPMPPPSRLCARRRAAAPQWRCWRSWTVRKYRRRMILVGWVAQMGKLVGLRSRVLADDEGDARINARIVCGARAFRQGYVAHSRTHERARRVMQIHA